MGTVNKDRMQQLEEMGRACRDAWQGRMAVVQAVPDMPIAMLRDTLPTYRSWLGALAAMNHGWLGIAGSGAQLLDPMLPWHWLGMGLQGTEIAESFAGESLRSSASTISAAHSQPMSQPRSRFLQESPIHRPSIREQKEKQVPADETYSFPEVQSPSISRPNSVKENAGKQSQHRKINSPQPPSTEKNALSANPFPEERKQIVFRGLDEFAAFVQQPAALEKADEEVERSSFELENWEELPQDSEILEGNSQAFPTREKGILWDQQQGIGQQKGAISGTDLPEEFHPESGFLQNPSAPKNVSKITPDLARLPAWEQVHAQWEQLTEVPRLTAKPPKIAPSRQVAFHPVSIQQPEEKLASPQRVYTPAKEANPRAKQQLHMPAREGNPKAKQQLHTPAREGNPQAQDQAHTHAVQPAVQHSAITSMPWMGSPQTNGAHLDESFKVEALMEALTEQLQRDFKRYYGG